MTTPIQSHIRLFDQVELVITTVGAKLKSTVEPDGRIHFDVIGSDESVIQSGVATFHVFWANQRQNRALFDREVLEQLIIKRVQDFHNEISLLRVVITRVELEEVRALQDENVSQLTRHTWPDLDSRRGLGVMAQRDIPGAVLMNDVQPVDLPPPGFARLVDPPLPGFADFGNDAGKYARTDFVDSALETDGHIGTLVSDASYSEPAPLGQDHPAAVVID